MKHFLKMRLSFFGMLMLVVALLGMVACGETPVTPPDNGGDAEHTHQWTPGEDTATCITDGTLTYTCSCGETKQEQSVAQGHQWGEGKVTAQPTCERNGTTTYNCTACGAKKQDAIPATGHTYDNSNWTSDASFHWYAATCGCSVTGDKAYHELDKDGKCTICGYATGIKPEDRQLEFKLIGGTYRVSGIGNVIGSTIIIPGTYNDKPVSQINSEAFANNLYITTLIVEEGVTAIKDNAFNGCLNLTSVSLPAGCASVATTAFGNTIISHATIHANGIAALPKSHLESVTVLAGEVIPAGAFKDAEKLTALSLPDTLTDVGAGSFLGCVSLVSVSYAGDIDAWQAIRFDSTPLAGGVTLSFSDGMTLSVPSNVVHHDKVAGDSFLEQPDYVYRKDYDKDNDVTMYFPELSKVTSSRNEVPIYGIYTDGNYYSQYRNQILDIGFRCIRSNYGSINDIYFSRFCEDEMEVMYTVGNSVMPFVPDNIRNNKDELKYYLNSELEKWKSNPNNSDLTEWFELNLNNVLNFLRRYGPNGTFFQDYPEANYKPAVAIETFNEPNFGYMISGLGNHDMIKTKLYAALHNYLYDAIKAEYGDSVTVVAFGAGGAASDDVVFIKQTLEYSSAMKDKMDIISTHPYWDGSSPFVAASGSIPRHTYEIRESAGDADFPIWWTEGGYQIHYADGGTHNYGEAGGKGFSTPLEQGAMLVQQYVLGMRLGVERIMYMYINDSDNCNYGILSMIGEYRKSAYAIRTLTTMMPDPLLKEAVMEGKDAQGNRNDAYVYTFESEVGGVDVTLAFAAQEKVTIDIPWDGEYAMLTDMMGVSRLISAENGVITLEVGAYMQYLTPVEIGQ